MLLFDHLQMDQPSLEQHSLSIFTNEGKKISKQAVFKRFNDKTVCFLRTLFENYLQHQLPLFYLPSGLKRYFNAGG